MDPAAIFVARLNRIDVPWMATGSIAAMTYGEYRVTNDLDIVIVLDSGAIGRLATAFPDEEFYRPPEDIIELEVRREQRGHFNLIHHETGFKADVYLRGRDSLDEWAFRRRQSVPFAGEQLWVAPPEYVIIRKLEFFREGRSEKHLRDIRGMLAVSDVDRAFIESEIAKRALQDEWRAATGLIK